MSLKMLVTELVGMPPPLAIADAAVRGATIGLLETEKLHTAKQGKIGRRQKWDDVRKMVWSTLPKKICPPCASNLMRSDSIDKIKAEWQRYLCVFFPPIWWSYRWSVSRRGE